MLDLILFGAWTSLKILGILLLFYVLYYRVWDYCIAYRFYKK